MKRVRNQKGIEFNLGEELGYGGEGRVFAIRGNNTLVAKIYHDPIPEEKLEKLQIMTQMKDTALLEVAAWPIDILYQENDGLACGVLLPRIDDFNPLHILHNPSNRKKTFPYADWRFLVEVASNLSEVVALIHDHGHVIGDINSGNFVVGKNAEVHAIDCDSYQIDSENGKTIRCEVGVLEYTAPEIQGVNYSTIDREENHDNFGLAVLIFQLLFLGRHPFAGVPLNNESNTISDAIRKGLFAYGADAKKHGIKKPPLGPRLSICNSEVGILFEEAFEINNPERPSADRWRDGLDRIGDSLRSCRENDFHRYRSGLKNCPWCELEARSSGLSLFPSLFEQTLDNASELIESWKTIESFELQKKGNMVSIENVRKEFRADTVSQFKFHVYVVTFFLFITGFKNPWLLLPATLLGSGLFFQWHYRGPSLESEIESLNNEVGKLQSDWADNTWTQNLSEKKASFQDIWSSLHEAVELLHSGTKDRQKKKLTIEIQNLAEHIERGPTDLLRFTTVVGNRRSDQKKKIRSLTARRLRLEEELRRHRDTRRNLGFKD